MTSSKTSTVGANYDLGPDQLSALEEELVDEVQLGVCGEGITAVWLGSEHRYANIVRNHEVRLFPEVHDSTAADERKTLFLALVDTRPGTRGVVHGATVCGAGSGDHGVAAGTAASTGFISIDHLIELGNFSAYEFESYYAAEDIDLRRCLSVESNFRIGHKVPHVWGLSTSTIAYLMFFRFLLRSGARRNRAMVFADVNQVSRISLLRNGIRYAPLMGRTDLVTPEAALGRSSRPVALPVDDALHDVFLNMRADVPEIFLGVDEPLGAPAAEVVVPPAVESS